MVNSVSFNLNPTQLSNLFNAVDGMQKNSNPDWAQYPERSVNPWGIGFTNNFDFISGLNFVQDPGDGFLSFSEKGMAAHQLAWGSNQGREYNDYSVNADPITVENAQIAETFLNSTFWNDDSTSPPGQAGQIREGLDLNNDGQLALDELQTIALLDGDENLTNNDFDIAYQNFVNGAASTEIDPPTSTEADPDMIEVDPPTDAETNMMTEVDPPTNIQIGLDIVEVDPPTSAEAGAIEIDPPASANNPFDGLNTQQQQQFMMMLNFLFSMFQQFSQFSPFGNRAGNSNFA